MSSPALLTDPNQVPGPSLHSTVVGNFADAQLAATPTTTRIQEVLEVNAATINQDLALDTPLAAILLRKMDAMSNRMDVMSDRMTGMQATIVAAVLCKPNF